MDPTARTELSIAELRSVQLELLAEFDRLCRAHDLVYFLAYGTLLGAVRHGGYIPWDDDVDVMMPRADYDRLPEVFATTRPPHLVLGGPPTQREWPMPYAKISDDRTQLFEPLQDPLPLGVNLDVFPIDPVPSGRLTAALQASALRLLRWAVELRYIRVERGRGWHHPFALTAVKPLLRLLPARVLVGAFTRVAELGRGAGRRLGVRVGSYDWSVPAGCLSTAVACDFEGLRLLVPTDPEAVLVAMYGDYRVLPPAAERISHHAFTAIWRGPSPA